MKGQERSVGDPRLPRNRRGRLLKLSVEALLRHREKPFRRVVEVGEAVNQLRRHTPRRPSVTSVEDPGMEGIAGVLLTPCSARLEAAEEEPQARSGAYTPIGLQGDLEDLQQLV
jgi:hypothetical protein